MNRGTGGWRDASEVNYTQVQPPVVTVTVVAARWYMVGFHDLVALQRFQVDIEAPQAVQVFEHLVGGASISTWKPCRVIRS